MKPGPFEAAMLLKMFFSSFAFTTTSSATSLTSGGEGSEEFSSMEMISLDDTAVRGNVRVEGRGWRRASEMCKRKIADACRNRKNEERAPRIDVRLTTEARNYDSLPLTVGQQRSQYLYVCVCMCVCVCVGVRVYEVATDMQR